MVTRKKVECDFVNFKEYAKLAFKRAKYDEACKLIKTASKIAYHFNFKYSDKELDGLIKELSIKNIIKGNFNGQLGKYVFYDSFGYDNRGLTQQYIKALKKWDVDFLYILESENSQCCNIIQELNEHEKAEILVLPSFESYIAKSQLIYEKISQYNPEKIFMHLAPWSVEALIAMHAIAGPKKYLIDLTDHAFWLGADVAEYYISFRGYGEFISNEFRGISADKIMRQPYYPIINNDEFKGFDFDTDDKTIIFTGGTYYKMYGEGNTFLNIIVRICKENPNAIVLIAGSGEPSPINKIIRDNNLQDKVYLIGNRSDISSVFKNIDIYLNTYPIIGGLMSQYAVSHNKPLIGYTSKNIPCNVTEGLFVNVTNRQIGFTYYDLDDLHHEINRLISCKTYRVNKANECFDIIPTEEEFFIELKNNVENSKVIGSVEKIDDFDIEKFSSLYFDMENNYIKSYDRVKLSEMKLLYFKYNFLDALGSSLKIIMSKVLK
ncbi:hypothetical protein ORI98_01290 [Shewanella sp. ULN5]|uniref:glycosyltransferase n=1 Tax=Shewanella sp. ULN5 TaxID=2994678 RepID=UPI00273E9675|nr:hypothetical protein [Shewanella sp. ULN5]MDP5145075.1 hypothetical protein [Shewanella sp. ULN5]